MSDNWQADLKTSGELFRRLVWPVVRRWCGDGRIIHVEALKDNDIARSLDVHAGIDVWQIVDGSGARGIASRVQAGKFYSFRTFTIRKDRQSGALTEWQKRVEAVRSGRWTYPILMCHAYADDDILYGVAMARTIDVVRAIDEGKGGERATGNATFYYVPWTAVMGVKTYDIGTPTDGQDHPR